MARFQTQIPYINRIKSPAKEAGASLGPFADQQMQGQEFLNKYLSDLKDTNPVLPAKKYGPFKEDLDLVQAGKQIIPNTGKDPFAVDGGKYLSNFLAGYDRSLVVPQEDRVNPRGITEYVQSKAEKPKEFPGSEGTAVS